MALSSKLAALDASERARARRQGRHTRKAPGAKDHALQGAVTRITEADRHNPDMSPAAAVDFEIRAAFAQFPTGDRMRRVLQVCRIMRRTVPTVAAHLTDEHLRHLWRTRNQEVRP